MSITGETTHSKLIGYCLLIFGFTGAHRFYFGKTVTGTIFFVLSILTGIGVAFWPLMILIWPFSVILGAWWVLDIFLMRKIASEAEQSYIKGNYNYSVAWLLHTYSGLFGAHRFYLGKWVTGFLYLFTGGLLGIGVIYDFYTLNARVSEYNASGKPAWWDRFLAQSN